MVIYSTVANMAVLEECLLQVCLWLGGELWLHVGCTLSSLNTTDHTRRREEIATLPPYLFRGGQFSETGASRAVRVSASDMSEAAPHASVGWGA
jgi:hypothetical protein